VLSVRVNGVSRNSKEGPYVVTAIVSVYNCARYLPGRLEDLLRQTLGESVEIVVVDSGSQQGEGEIVREFQRRHRNIVYLRTEQRESIYGAWNRGIRAASGRYITNANSDDRHRPDALELMARVLDEEPGADLVYADSIITRNENETFETCRPAGWMNCPDDRDIRDRASFWLVGMLGPMPMWRKSLHDRFGWFDETLDVAGDLEFWMRLAEKCRFRHIPQYLGLYFWNEGSAERRNYEMTARETVEVGFRYLYQVTADRKSMALIRRTLSEKCADLGNYYLMGGDRKSARAACHRGIRTCWTYGGNYRFLLASCLPRSVVEALRKRRARTAGTQEGSVAEYKKRRQDHVVLENPMPGSRVPGK
jgi:glycosyltransferase involved in cell wall biosynthesis